MPEFIATMRVVSIQTWSVEAPNESAARRMIDGMHESVATDETGGETVDWEIESIKPDSA